MRMPRSRTPSTSAASFAMKCDSVVKGIGGQGIALAFEAL